MITDRDTGDEDDRDAKPDNVLLFSAFQLPEPADLDRIVREVVESSRAIVEERTRPYREGERRSREILGPSWVR